ncbi:MAG: transcriptional repressor [Muribaculaceae bacterium]|nr:transcriptional repressor [Muribaculaceae bacterium]
MNQDIVEMTFRRFLNRGHYRKTPERFTILRRALTMKAHFDVETLHDALESDGYHVSRATVYNTVQLLEKAGILRKNVFAQSTALYELCRDNHIHLVCRRCGRIREVSEPHIEEHMMALETPDFTPENFSITITGLCDKCKC